MAANAGFDVALAGDASAAFAATGPDGRRRDARTVHDVELAAPHGEGSERSAQATENLTPK